MKSEQIRVDSNSAKFWRKVWMRIENFTHYSTESDKKDKWSLVIVIYHANIL